MTIKLSANALLLVLIFSSGLMPPSYAEIVQVSVLGPPFEFQRVSVGSQDDQIYSISFSISGNCSPYIYKCCDRDLSSGDLRCGSEFGENWVFMIEILKIVENDIVGWAQGEWGFYSGTFNVEAEPLEMSPLSGGEFEIKIYQWWDDPWYRCCGESNSGCSAQLVEAGEIVFNNGFTFDFELGEETPVTHSLIGSVKALYR